MNPRSLLARPALRRALALALRVSIGAVFVYASLDKIAHPDRFAEIVSDYQLLPDALVNPFAVVLPWVELVTGILLVIGRRLPSAAVLAAAMTSMFIVALAYVLAHRTEEFHCGCFTTTQEGGLGPAQVLWRDAVLLAACVASLALTYRASKAGGDEALAGQPTLHSRQASGGVPHEP